jgi:hypothetical protein
MLTNNSPPYAQSVARRGWWIRGIALSVLLVAPQSSHARARVKLWLPIPVIRMAMDNHFRRGTAESRTNESRAQKKASNLVSSKGRNFGSQMRVSRGASEGTAPYPTGGASDFYGPMGPRIRKVPGRSLAYSYASQGYFNRAKVCVARGDGTMRDIAEGKAVYAKSNEWRLTPFGQRLTKGVKYVPRKIVTCPECDGTGRGYYSGSCW